MRATTSSASYKPPSKDDVAFFVQVVDEAVGGKDGIDPEHAKLREQQEQSVMTELNITKDKNVVLKINKSFIELAMKANGKADLYFH